MSTMCYGDESNHKNHHNGNKTASTTTTTTTTSNNHRKTNERIRRLVTNNHSIGNNNPNNNSTSTSTTAHYSHLNNHGVRGRRSSSTTNTWIRLFLGGIMIVMIVVINVQTGLRLLSSTTSSPTTSSSSSSTTITTTNNKKIYKDLNYALKTSVIRSSSSLSFSTAGRNSTSMMGRQQHNNNNNNIVDYSSLLVQPNDYIYYRDVTRYDAAPIVVEEYKLVFFSVPKVACTTFKFLFRRMHGIEDWDNQDDSLILPHNPEANNLTYLWDYPMEIANDIMTNPEWTRAIFVRDPKLRFLSAFLDKAVENDGWHVLKSCCTTALDCKGIPPTRQAVRALLEECHYDEWNSRQSILVPIWNDDIPCCSQTRQCREQAESITGFLKMIQSCRDEHWEPQYARMEKKYWNYINFVGHMENLSQDTQRLLERIGAWEDYGKTGWGDDGQSSLLETAAFTRKQSHTTGANHRIYQWYTPQIERMVESFYAADYRHGPFNFSKTNLTEDPVEDAVVDGDILKSNDWIYKRGDWDGSPIVVERYKLIFFTLPEVGATTWKQAFRRMEGLDDWQTLWERGLPHDPETNGLKYLYHYPILKAEEMMTSNEWTRAIFVMSPKDRFLSVFHLLSHDYNFVTKRCCPTEPGCASTIGSMPRFVELMETCYSTHWAPITERMEEKWWPYINFIGSLQTIEEDSKRLLEQIGAWDEIGKSGWGTSSNSNNNNDDDNDRIFPSNTDVFNNAREALREYTPQVDKMLDKYYSVDYKSKYFSFRSKSIWAMHH